MRREWNVGGLPGHEMEDDALGHVGRGMGVV